MFNTIRQLITLAARSDKLWVIPVVLSLIIVALLVIAANTAPVPLFVYPLL